MRLERNASHLVPATEDWISYAVRETGFHFLLDKRVPGTMEMLAPVLRTLIDRHGWEVGAMDFFIVHAGGPRILDDLCHYLELPPEMFATRGRRSPSGATSPVRWSSTRWSGCTRTAGPERRRRG